MAEVNKQIFANDFIEDDIFKLLGLEKAPENKKKEMLDNMMTIIQNRVISRILDSLGAEERKEMDKLIEAKETEKIYSLLDKKGVNMDAITAEEALNLKMEMINMFNSQKTDKTK